MRSKRMKKGVEEKRRYCIEESLDNVKQFVRKVEKSFLIPGRALFIYNLEITCPYCKEEKWIAKKKVWYECPKCNLCVQVDSFETFSDDSIIFRIKRYFNYEEYSKLMKG